MIKIKVPEMDLIIKRGECNKIPDRKSGVYLLYSNEDGFIYVGQTKDLKTRIYAHFAGCTNTSRFAEHFDYCEMFYEDDLMKREIYEYYLINTDQPILNTAKRNYNVPSNEIIKAQSKPIRCKGIKKDGTKCRSYAHSNGFCYMHGGNGISYSSIREQAIKKVIEEEINAGLHEDIIKEQPTAK